MKSLTSVLLVLLLAAKAPPSWAQSSSMKELRAAFERLDYATADSLANLLLHDEQKLLPAQIVEVRQILAIIDFTEGRSVEARQQFELALSIDPQLQLDPVTVSPKILSFFEKVKADFSRSAPKSERVHYRYLLIPDPRPAAALRSLLFPGLGQFYKGQGKRGVVFMLAAGSGAAATLVFHIARARARRDYLAEQDVSKIPSRYDHFNSLNRRRNVAGLFTATVWLTGFVDALLSQPKVDRSRVSMRLVPAAQPPGFAVLASLRF